MNTNELLKLISGALNIDLSNLKIDSLQENIEEWDSLGHLNILVQLDKATNGKASTLPELVEAKSVGDLIKVLSNNNLLKNK